jgi:hypothetical protein
MRTICRATLTRREAGEPTEFSAGILGFSKEVLIPMRLKISKLLCAITLLTLAVPVWARTHSTTAYSDGSTTIAGTQLKAGDYELKVEDNGTELQVIQEGKLVAHVPVQWVQLPNRAKTTEVMLDNDRITEVHFGGDTQAVQIRTNK